MKQRFLAFIWVLSLMFASSHQVFSQLSGGGALDQGLSGAWLTNSLTGVGERARDVLPEKGLHHKHVRWVQKVTNEVGETLDVTNAYLHMQPGLHYLTTNGQLAESRPVFGIKGGVAVADQLQFKVRIGGNIASAGYLEVTMPDGKNLRSHLSGLRYYDPVSGQAAIISAVKNTQAYIVADNQVVFPNAFSNVTADVRYTISVAGIEQDVLVHPEAPLPAPEDYGLPSATARLEVISEFLNPPPAARRSSTNDPSATRITRGGALSRLRAEDIDIDFGSMQIGEGTAFKVASGTNGPPITVGKRWLRLNSSGQVAADNETAARQFLIEAVDVVTVEPVLPTELMPQGGATLKRSGRKTIMAQSDFQAVPPTRDGLNEEASVRRDPPSSLLAALAGPLLVLDYVEQLNNASYTDFVFRSDMTYFVTGNHDFYGTTVLEGGAVIKMDLWPQNTTPQHQLVIHGPVVCKTSATLPLMITARDDDTVGAIPTTSTGTVTYGYGTYGFYFAWNAPAVELKHIHFAHLTMGAAFFNGKANRLLHSQFFKGGHAVLAGSSSSIYVGNALIQQGNDLCGIGSGGTGVFEHVTSDRCYQIHPNYFTGGVFTLRNCLVITGAPTSGDLSDPLDGGGNKWAGSTNGLFVGAFGGNHYLPGNSAYRDAGVSGIDSALAADLVTMTTEAPHGIASSITVNTILKPVVSPDTSPYDVGFHYTLIDYACKSTAITGATVTLTNGASLMYAYGSAFSLRENAKFYSTGLPTKLNRLLHYHLVQESAIASESSWAVFSSGVATVVHPVVSLRFTEASMFGGSSWGGLMSFGLNSGQQSYRPIGTFRAQDCQFANMWIYAADGTTDPISYTFFNNVLNGGQYRFYKNTSAYNQDTPMSVVFQNNLFFRTRFTLAYEQATVNPNWIITDNVFDGVTNLNYWVTTTLVPSPLTVSSNAFAGGTTPVGINFINLGATPASYGNGPLGRWYSANTQWVDLGSRPANEAGLYYYYTAKAGETKEGTSRVDWGFHYITTKSSSDATPLDTDNDGAADYREDPAGTGATTGGTELGGTGTSYLNPDMDLDGALDGEELANGTDPNNAASIFQKRLAIWTFDDPPNLKGDHGQEPVTTLNLGDKSSWSGRAVEMGTTAVDGSARKLAIRVHETNPLRLNLGLKNGTVRFWYRPNWTSSNFGVYGDTQILVDACLFTVGTKALSAPYSGYWSLDIAHGSGVLPEALTFSAQYPGNNTSQSMSQYVQWQWGEWHQIAFTYGTTAPGGMPTLIFYIDGEYMVSRQNVNMPEFTASIDSLLFTLGADSDGSRPAKGRFDNLETFNYPLSAQQIQSDYRTLAKIDTDQDLLSNIREDSIGTDPSVTDTDGDGLPDGFEAGFTVWMPDGSVITQIQCPVLTLNPKVHETIDDIDGDGVVNTDELTAHSSPIRPKVLPLPEPLPDYDKAAGPWAVVNVDFTADPRKKLSNSQNYVPKGFAVAGYTNSDAWNIFSGVNDTTSGTPDAMQALHDGIPLMDATNKPSGIKMYVGLGPWTWYYQYWHKHIQKNCNSWNFDLLKVPARENAMLVQPHVWFCRDFFWEYFWNTYINDDQGSTGVLATYPYLDRWQTESSYHIISSGDAAGGDSDNWPLFYPYAGAYTYGAELMSFALDMGPNPVTSPPPIATSYGDYLYSSANCSGLWQAIASDKKRDQGFPVGTQKTVIALSGMDDCNYRIYICALTQGSPCGSSGVTSLRGATVYGATGQPNYPTDSFPVPWDNYTSEGSDLASAEYVAEGWQLIKIHPKDGMARIILSEPAAISAMQIIKQLPPGQVGNLAVKGGMGGFRLSWDAVPGANRYDVYRADDLAGPYSKIGSVSRGKLPIYEDYGHKDGDSKWFYVVAAYDDLSGPPSNIATDTTTVCYYAVEHYKVVFEKLNHPPVFLGGKPMTGAKRDQELNISLAAITGATGAKDWDKDDVLQFQIQANVRAGTLKLYKGTSTAPATLPAIYAPGDRLVWTPPAGAVTGSGIDVFEVRAFDGVLYSEQISKVAITIDYPSVLFGWGDQQNGKLGDGGLHLTWQQGLYVDADYAHALTADPQFIKMEVPSGTAVFENPQDVATGSEWRVAAAADGTLYDWGRLFDRSVRRAARNMVGAAYDVFNAAYPIPSPIYSGPPPAGLFDGVRKIEYALSADTAIALRADGTVWSCWDDAGLDYPQQIPFLENVTDIAADNSAGAALMDGKIWWWGDVETITWLDRSSEEGVTATGGVTVHRLPNDSVAPDSRPIHIRIPADPLTRELRIVQVAVGDGYYLALADDGTVWEFGIRYRNGIQVGTGGVQTIVNSDLTDQLWDPVPAKVESLSGVRSVATNGRYSLALLDDGTVKAWGYHFAYNPGSWISKSPRALPRLEHARSISVGAFVAFAVDEHDRLWAWGENWNKQLLLDDVYYYTSEPALVEGLDHVTGAFAGVTTSYAIASTLENRPTHFTALPGNNAIKLTWRAFPNATRYHIKRSTMASSGFQEVAFTDAEHFTDLGLENLKTYYYVVSADLSTGVPTLDSQIASATPISPPITAPGNLTARISCRRVGLSWDGDSTMTGYKVYRFQANGPASLVGTAFPDIKMQHITFVDDDVANGSYSYYVVGFNSGGSGPKSAPSAVVSAGTASCVAGPAITGGTLSWETYGDDQRGYLLTLAWTPPVIAPESGKDISLTGYKIKIYHPASKSYIWYSSAGGDATSSLPLPVHEGIRWSYVISALVKYVDSSDGSVTEIETADSQPFEITPRPIDQLGPVTGLGAVAGNNCVMLVWDLPEIVGAYEVQYRLHSATQWIDISIPDTQEVGAEGFANRMYFWHQSLPSGSGNPPLNGNSYDYRVRGWNQKVGQGPETSTSGWSTVVTITPKGIVPAATPLVVTAGQYAGKIHLRWPATGGGYPDDWQFFVHRRVKANPPVPASAWTIPSVLGRGVSFMDDEVADGVVYEYEVIAFDRVGNRIISNRVEASPASSAGFYVSTTVGNGFITLKWPASATAEANGDLTYVVWRSTSEDGPWERAATVDPGFAAARGNIAPDNASLYMATDRAVGNGTLYFYYVSAVAGAGELFKSVISAVSPSPQGAPAAIGFTANFVPLLGDGQLRVAVTWTPSDGATAAQIQTAWGDPYTPPIESAWQNAVTSSSSQYLNQSLSLPITTPGTGPSALTTLWIRARGLHGTVPAGGDPSTLPHSEWKVSSELDYAQWHAHVAQTGANDANVWFVGLPTSVTAPTNLVLHLDTLVASPVRVNVYADGQLIGSCKEKPFQITWYGVPARLTSYALQAEVYAKDGTFLSAPKMLEVKWNPTLADYTTESSDLEISAPGLPISVGRKYSSATEATSTLAYGWAASWLTPQITVDSPLETGWKAGKYYALQDKMLIGETTSHLVRVQLPDGQELDFRATIAPASVLTLMGGEAQLDFAPDIPGTGTLTWNFFGELSARKVPLDDGDTVEPVAGDVLRLVVGDDLSKDISAPLDDNYMNGVAFTYASPDGVQWTFRRMGGSVWKLASVKDRAGNYQTYNYSGANVVIKAYGPTTSLASPIRVVTINTSSTSSADTVLVYDPIEAPNGTISGSSMPAVRYFIDKSTGTPLLKAVDRLVNRIPAGGGSAQYAVTRYLYGSGSNPSVNNNLNRLVSVKQVPQLVSATTAAGLASFDVSSAMTLLSNAYDGNGKLQKQTDARGRETTLTINTTAGSYQIQASQTVGGVSTQSAVNYGANGLPSSTVDPNSINKRVEYDGEARPLNMIDPDGSTKTMAYDGLGRPIGETDQEGYVSSSQLNEEGSPVVMTDKNGNVATAEYDPLGNPLSEMDSAEKQTHYFYENANFPNLPTKVMTSGPGITGELVTESQYNARGELQTQSQWLSVNGASAIQTDYTYDDNGNTLTEKHYRTVAGSPVAMTTTMVVDAMGRAVKTTDPLGQNTVSTFDVFGRTTQTTDAFGRTTQMYYDALGNLVQTIYPDGTLTRTVFDEANRPVFVQDRLDPGATTLASAQNPSSTSTTMGSGNYTQYDSGGRVIATIRYQSSSVTLQPETYSVNSTFSQVATTLGTLTSGNIISRTRTIYDTNGRVAYRLDALGSVAGYQYDKTGRVVAEKRATTQRPSDLLDPTAAFSASGLVWLTTSYGYDGNGNRIWMVDANNQTAAGTDPNTSQHQTHRTDYVYDSANRLISTKAPAVTTESNARKERTTQYDALGRKTLESDESGVITVYTYDWAGRLIAVIQDSKASYEAGSFAQSTRYEYDEVGNLITVRDAMDGYTVAADGTPSTSTVAKRAVRYEYDHLGRRTKTVLPDPSGNGVASAEKSEVTVYSTWTISTGISGLLQTVTDFNGNATTTKFDILDRPLQRQAAAVFNEPPVSFTYTPRGQRATMSDVSGVTQYTYDSVGRLQKKITPAGRITYGYNANDALTSMVTSSTSGASLAYGYDALNRLSTVQNNRLSSNITTYQYDNAGNLQDVILPSAVGVKHHYTYNEQYRLKQVDHLNTSSASRATFQYTLDASGHRTQLDESLTDGTPTSTHYYKYDTDSQGGNQKLVRLYRLTEETWNDGKSWQYRYDRVGNRLARTTKTSVSDPGTVRGASFDARDRMSQDRIVTGTTGASPAPLYDDNGNQLRHAGNFVNGDTTADQSANDVFNSENRLKTRVDTTADGTKTFGLTYDGDGNRFSKSSNAFTTLYLVDDRNPSGYAQVLEETYVPSTTSAGLVGRWIFNETEGTAASDISGNGRHGTLVNSPTWTTGKLGTGLQFGTVGGQQVQVPDQTALRLGTTLTLSFWMKLDSVPSAATRLVGKGASDTAQNYGVWTAAGDQHLFFKFHNGTTLQSVSTTTTFSTGTWYHVAVTLGSGQVQFYVNGAAQSAVAATGTPVTSTDPLTFGYAGYNGTFGGSLDEVSLFNTVLTSSQVSDLYATYGMGLVCRYNVGTDLIGQERYSAATSLWAASYYGYDGLGSVRVLYDSIGTTTDTYTYDAFGTLNSSTGSTTNYYRFAGEQWDEDLKLYYNRARYLNPDTGRFTSRDTFEAGSGDIGNLHRYLYVGGDPLNHIDPSGHDLVETLSVLAINTANFAIRAWPTVKIGLAIWDATTVVRILNKAFHGEPVSTGEWAQFGLATVGVFGIAPGSKFIARKVIGAFLDIPINQSIRTFQGAKLAVGRFARLIQYEEPLSSGGIKAAGLFSIENGMPIIRYWRQSSDLKTAHTLIHEYLHYAHWVARGKPAWETFWPMAKAFEASTPTSIFDKAAALILELAK